MALGPAVGEAPVAIEIAIGILACVAWVVAAGLHWTWIRTLGWIFDKIGSVSILGTHPLAFVKDAGDSVGNAFATIAKGSNRAMGVLFHWAGVMQGWIAREVAGLAEDVFQTLAWLTKVQLRLLVKGLAKAGLLAILPALIARWLVKNLGHYLAHYVRVITHTVTHTTVSVIKQVAGAGYALPGRIAHLPGRVRGVERDVTNIWKRIGRLERRVGATGAVALFVAALAKLGLNWLRCRNVGRAAKRICGMDTGLLDELLTDTLLVIGAVSVVEFARGMRSIEDEALKIMHGIVREFPG